MAEKKTGGLEGVIAGNTSISTVGKQGVGLTYRGYSIDDLAAHSCFEEVAYLLIHGELPNAAKLAAYKAKLKGLRGLSAPVRGVLEQLPPTAHPMDVMRTGTSALGCVLPEAESHDSAGTRDIADRLIACLGSMLCYWYHFARSGRRIEVATSTVSRVPPVGAPRVRTSVALEVSTFRWVRTW